MLAPKVAGAQLNLPPAVRADSAALDSLFAPSAPAAWRQALFVRAVGRWYNVGSPQTTGRSINERSTTLTYQVRGPHLSARLDVNPLTYETTQSGVGTSLAGLTPIAARLEWRWREGDTTRLFARGATRPRTLDSTQTSAIGAAGTSTIELDAVALGTPVAVGLRQTAALPLSDAITISLRGSVESSERPASGQSIYWTGTTVRAGAAVILRPASATRLVASLDLSRSFADSLGGSNLFPGGGTVFVDLRAQGPLGGPESPVFGQVQTFFSRPYGNTRADQPNRLIPQGDFFGANSALTIDVGPVMVMPTLGTMVESGRAESRRTFARSQFRGLAWSATGGLAVVIPLGTLVEVTPEIAVVGGNVSQEYLTSVVNPLNGRVRTVSEAKYTFPTKGRVLTIEVAVRF
jgi:hypothetical protein